MNATTLDSRVAEKVLDGERITAEDAIELYRLPLGELGQLADHRRQRAKAGAFGGRGNQIVTYIVDRNINYTNVCNVYCKFCAFYRTERDSDHYVLSHDDIDQKIDELVAIGGIPLFLWGACFRIVFGLHATWLVNSATHMWGSRRFSTRDDSRNSWWVAMLTFGEG